MLDALRTILHRAITTPQGDGLPTLRLQKDVARRLNRMLGSPLCSAEELATRRAARERLAELRAGARPSANRSSREPAPVVVYCEKNRNQRMISRVEEALHARGIVYRLLDVTGDEATLDFVRQKAKCEDDDLPIVFVAGTVVGGYAELVEWDVSGRLTEAVFGPSSGGPGTPSAPAPVRSRD
jgi:glutaredoxin